MHDNMLQNGMIYLKVCAVDRATREVIAMPQVASGASASTDDNAFLSLDEFKRKIARLEDELKQARADLANANDM